MIKSSFFIHQLPKPNSNSISIIYSLPNTEIFLHPNNPIIKHNPERETKSSHQENLALLWYPFKSATAFSISVNC